MKLCPKCSAELKDTAKFCSECGLNLAQYEQENSKKCPSCGALLTGGKYCEECGAAISAPNKSTNSGFDFSGISNVDFSAMNSVAHEQLYAKEGFVVENGVLVKYKGKKRDVEIPDSIEDISDSAFENNDLIINVSIGSGVKIIGKRAFANCRSLIRVSIPANCYKIYEDAFEGTHLEELVLEVYNDNFEKNVLRNVISPMALGYHKQAKIQFHRFIMNPNAMMGTPVRFDIKGIEKLANSLKAEDDQKARDAEAKRIAEEKAKKEAEEKAKKEAEAKKKAEAKRKAEEKKRAEEARRREVASWYVGSVHTIGSYKGYPIEWIVVSVSTEGFAEVVAKNGIEYLPYHSSFADVEWKDCSLRKWLNNDFYNSAFTYSEKCKILSANVPATMNPKNQKKTVATEDIIYILSGYQVKAFFPEEKSRPCQPSNYVMSKSDFKSSVDRWGLTLNKTWWLRNRGNSYDNVIVGAYGEINYDGSSITNKHLVRPAMLYEF